MRPLPVQITLHPLERWKIPTKTQNIGSLQQKKKRESVKSDFRANYSDKVIKCKTTSNLTLCFAQDLLY